MRGRAKRDAAQIVLLAHTGEAFARTKRLRPAEHYLKTNRDAAKAPPSAVAAMLGKMQKAGLAVNVRRIPANERKRFNGGNDSRLS